MVNLMSVIIQKYYTEAAIAEIINTAPRLAGNLPCVIQY